MKYQVIMRKNKRLEVEHNTQGMDMHLVFSTPPGQITA